CRERFAREPERYLGPPVKPTPPAPTAPTNGTVYTCPMHPEIVRDRPGSCPICGMALEPRTPTAGMDEESPELAAMTRRFWVSAVLSLPLLLIDMGAGMGEMVAGFRVPGLSVAALRWIELLLATPVVLWGGWPFFVRGWASLVHRSLNMFT